MADRILSGLVGNQDVRNMRVSEAKKLIAEFYLRMEIETVGYSDPHKMDFFCQRALQKYGLDLLA